MRPLFASLIALAAWIAAAATSPAFAQAPPPSLFCRNEKDRCAYGDQPVATRQLPGGTTQDGAPITVICRSFPRFTIRERIFHTDIGAEVLILPPHAPCDAAPTSGVEVEQRAERHPLVGAPGFWFARDELIFIRNWGVSNRQAPFAIYRYGEPARLFYGSIRVHYGPTVPGPIIRFQPQPAGSLRLHFTTTHQADCSVPTHGQACIRAIAAATGAPPVDPALCRAEYDRAAEFYRQNIDDDPTVVAYPVVLEIGLLGVSLRPNGAVAECFPAD